MNSSQEKLEVNKLQFLIDYSKGLEWIFLVILITSIFIGSYPSILALLFTNIVENILQFKSRNSLFIILLAEILGVYSLAAVCETIKFFAVPRFISDVTCQIRKDIHGYLLQRSYLNINEDKSDEGKQSVTFLRDLTIVEDMLHRLLDVSAIYLSRIVACFGLIFYYSIGSWLFTSSYFYCRTVCHLETELHLCQCQSSTSND